MTLVEQIQETSRKIKDGRSKYAVLAKATEELGELSQEVMIDAGDHYKEPGKDGIIGEAIDMIICGIDMILQHDPNFTEGQMQTIAQRKLLKWEATCNPRTDAFKDIITYGQQENLNEVHFVCRDGTSVYMTPTEFSKKVHNMVNGKIKGCFKYVDDRFIVMTHVIFGDIDAPDAEE